MLLKRSLVHLNYLRQMAEDAYQSLMLSDEQYEALAAAAYSSETVENLRNSPVIKTFAPHSLEKDFQDLKKGVFEGDDEDKFFQESPSAILRRALDHPENQVHALEDNWRGPDWVVGHRGIYLNSVGSTGISVAHATIQQPNFMQGKDAYSPDMYGPAQGA